MNKPAIKSVANAFEVLDFVLESSIVSGETSLNEVARKFQLSPPSARNMLQTLEFCGLIERAARGRYRAGVRCGGFAFAGGLAARIKPAAAPLLCAAAARTGESFLLAALRHGRRLTVCSAAGAGLITIDPETVEREQKFNFQRVTGRVLLACAPPAEKAEFLKLNPPELARGWRELEGRPERLEKLLRKIAGDGRCEDYVDDLYAAAIPAYDRSGRLIGALGVYSPKFRTGAAKRAELLAALDGIARKLSQLEVF